MVKIKKDIIPDLGQKELDAKKIVVAHESGNPNNTGKHSLNVDVKHMRENWKNAFVSDFIGSGGKAVQLAEPGKFQYGAGPKANPIAYAHVEMSRTKEKKTFEKDYKTWVQVLRKRADDASIPKTFDDDKEEGIKSHEWVSKNLGGTDHTDPFAYFESWGISRKQLKKDIENGIDDAPDLKDEKKKEKSKTKNNVSKWDKVTGEWRKDNSLHKGHYGKPVKQLQKKLVDNNFYPNKEEDNKGVDSYYGEDTQNAVERYQIMNGLKVDGKAGPNTFDALNDSDDSVSVPDKNMKLKSPQMKGKEVEQLQEALASIHFYPDKDAKDNGVDGYFGPDTEDAVKRFQSTVGLKEDGSFGPDTRKKLKRKV